MTSQLKKFIELQDMVGVHFECRRCHATLTLSLSADASNRSFVACPNCQESWARTLDGASIELTIQEFLNGFKKLSDALSRWNEHKKNGGFFLSLELCPEVDKK